MSDRELPRWLLPLGTFLFRHRNWVFPLVFLALVGTTRPALFRGNVLWDRWLDAVGVLLALGAQLLRAAVIGLAYIRRGGLDKRVYADSLVTTGLFAHSRNPLYLANYLAIVGLLVIHHALLAYLVGIPFFTLAFVAMVAAEEDFLRRRFGAEYEAYVRAVPRFHLRLAGLGRTLRSMPFDWRKLLRKEYGSTFSGTTAIIGLLLWEAYRQGGAAALRARIDVLGPLWAVLVILYLVAFTLKKSGVLGRAY
ncbi:MAG TPA: isoprenylcysteine carboxylmethyltransferase family protein [Thermoanaerobaculia bacterium]|nr:isoprenylcysteine carboxylmethyltransferase family protein [Thermoanaerobaculia bacterium]